MLTMNDVDLKNKRVLVREDLNVPIKDGKITNSERIQRALPTLKAALAENAAVMVMSHLGRPEEGSLSAEFSLALVADALAEALDRPVRLVQDWIDGVSIVPGEIILLENVRFESGEKKNNTELAKKMAALCDIFVMDAFATAHRSQASTVGVAEYAPVACAGPLLVAELAALQTAFESPKRPLVAIVGGSKVSTKIQLLDHLFDKVDVLIVGGGIANTLLAATGVEVGQSLYEAEWLERAREFLKHAKDSGVNVPLPTDVAVAKSFDANTARKECKLDAIEADDLILDVGAQTISSYPDIMQSAGTIIWNGPVGVFEFASFADGTRGLGQAIADSLAYSLAGGGDTVAAIDQFGYHDKISYISTGGGAFLEFIQGDALPAVKILEQRKY